MELKKPLDKMTVAEIRAICGKFPDGCDDSCPFNNDGHVVTCFLLAFNPDEWTDEMLCKHTGGKVVD